MKGIKMALLQECPLCHRRYSIKREFCACGFKFSKTPGKVYWIEYYIDGYRKRERIGKNKSAAEQRLREVLSLRTEGRYITKAKNIRVSFDTLAKWYLQLPQVKAKRSYDRDVLSIKHLGKFFAGKKISEITLSRVEKYRILRLNENAQHGNKTRPATVNRELACLRYMLRLAENEGIIESMPFKGLKMLKENNVRDRILTHKEYDKLIACCLPHTARIVMTAYYTAMRQGEILNLTWNRVDLKNKVIRLKAESTKTQEGRPVPLHSKLIKMLESMTKETHGYVFTLNGKPLKSISRSFKTACKLAGITDFRFHDLRHTCINNWRLEGHDFFRIMAASGHRTMSVFKRYNTVTEDEVKKLVDTADSHQYGHQEQNQAIPNKDK